MEKNRKILFIIFIFLLLALVGMYQNEQRKTLIIEAKQIVDAEKEKEKLLNAVNNPEITISSAIKSNGEYTFIMFTNLPDEAQIEGDILHIKNNSADEVIDTFKGVIKNERFVLEGTIDPTIFKKDNVAKLKFVGNIKVQDLSKTFETEIYDYTKYFLPPEPVEQIEEEMKKENYDDKSCCCDYGAVSTEAFLNLSGHRQLLSSFLFVVLLKNSHCVFLR